MPLTRRLALKIAGCAAFGSALKAQAQSPSEKEKRMLSNSKLGAISYFVSDIGKTETFWRETMGFSPERVPIDENEEMLMLKTANGIDLIFFQQEPRPGNSPVIVFELAEGGIDSVVANLAKAGVTIVTPVSHAPGGWTADFADPDGHAISLYQSEEMPR